MIRPATQQALALVAAGVKPYRAAKLMGIALPTIYRALKRAREQRHALSLPK